MKNEWVSFLKEHNRMAEVKSLVFVFHIIFHGKLQVISLISSAFLIKYPCIII